MAPSPVDSTDAPDSAADRRRRRRALLAFAAEAARVDDAMVVVPTPTNPLFVLPAQRSLTRRTLLSHNGLRTPLTQAQRAAVAAVANTGLLRLRRFAAAPEHEGDPLVDVLADALDEPGLTFAMGLSRFGRFAKPVLQLFSRDGEPVGFAKVGWTAPAASLVANEADALRRLADHDRRLFATPPVLCELRWREMPVVVTGPVPVEARRLLDTDFPVVAPMWEIAALHEPVTNRAAGDLDAVRRHRERVGADDTPMIRMLARLADVEVPVGSVHGDLVPWNMALHDNRLWIWDWEHAAAGLPVGVDIIHGHYQQERVSRSQPLARSLAVATERAWPHLRRLGLDDDQALAVAAAHRLDLFERLLAAGPLDAEKRWALLAPPVAHP